MLNESLVYIVDLGRPYTLIFTRHTLGMHSHSMLYPSVL